MYNIFTLYRGIKGIVSNFSRKFQIAPYGRWDPKHADLNGSAANSDHSFSIPLKPLSQEICPGKYKKK